MNAPLSHRIRVSRAEKWTSVSPWRKVVPGVDSGDLRELEPRIVAKVGAALIDTPTSV
jgi:hypothetical protein